MSKPDTFTSVAMADEENTREVVAIEGKFFRHYRAFLYCGLVCLGGFQLGRCHSCLLRYGRA